MKDASNDMDEAFKIYGRVYSSSLSILRLVQEKMVVGGYSQWFVIITMSNCESEVLDIIRHYNPHPFPYALETKFPLNSIAKEKVKIF